MPTGIAIRDVREQLFAAAERVLLRDGTNALTSRAVTTEAGVAKGVLHRHFADFDAFLTELVLDRIGLIDEQAGALMASVGTGSVADNLTDALTAVLGPVALAIVGLVSARDGLRERLRETTPTGIPVLTQAQAMIATYLAAEREHGRVATDDPEMLAMTLIGTAHMRFAGGDAPTQDAVRKIVRSAAGVLPPGRSPRRHSPRGRMPH